jgi:uncharacterized protein (TIGR02001 family)
MTNRLIRMKKDLVALVILVFTAGAAWAGSVPAGSAASWSVMVTPDITSQYMFRGVRRGGLSFQPAVEAGYGDLVLGVWLSTPLRDKVLGQSDPEIDPYGSYALRLTDALSLEPGFTVYTYPRAPLDQGFHRATFEPSLAVNYTVRGVKLTPRLYYDVVLEGATFELTATTAVPLTGLGTEVDFTAVAGTFAQRDVVNGAAPKVKNWGDYWLVGVAAPFAVSRSSKLTVGLAYTAGSGNYLKRGDAPRTKNPAAVGRGVLTVGYTWTY